MARCGSGRAQCPRQRGRRSGSWSAAGSHSSLRPPAGHGRRRTTCERPTWTSPSCFLNGALGRDKGGATDLPPVRLRPRRRAGRPGCLRAARCDAGGELRDPGVGRGVRAGSELGRALRGVGRVAPAAGGRPAGDGGGAACLCVLRGRLPGRGRAPRRPRRARCGRRCRDGRTCSPTRCSGAGRSTLRPRASTSGAASRPTAATAALDPAAVLAIGDGDNDVELFERAGQACAMSHATDRAKAAAHVTFSDGMDGWAQLLDYL